MAIEDSNSGAKSAEADGCTVLVVPNQVRDVRVVQDASVLIIGERTNTNGSKAFREAMLGEDWQKCLDIAKGRPATVVHERIGVTLSEELQLHPGQSTDAFVLHHPEANYFNV